MKQQIIRFARVRTMALGFVGTVVLALGPRFVAAESPMQSGTSSMNGGKSEAGHPPLSHQDTQFIHDAVEQNEASIALGFLAIEKGATNDVKKYGRQLIDEGVKSNKHLMELVSEKNVFVPLDQIKLPAETLNQLGQKPGVDFDRAFIQAVISAGVKAQAGLQQAVSQVRDADVRDFASKRLSRLGDALSDARDLGKNLGLASEQLNPPPPVAESPQPGATVPMASPSPERGVPPPM